jgi:hypothetical protein
MGQRTCIGPDCSNTFIPVRSTQRFCCRQCRINYNNWHTRTYRRVEKLKQDRESYLRHIEKRREASRRRWTPEKAIAQREYAVAWRKKIRDAVLAHLGGKCVRCGFDDWRALQVDHVNGNGTKEHAEKKSLTSYYLAVMDTMAGEKYQLLCANCNQIKRYENREGCGAGSKPKRQKHK